MSVTYRVPDTLRPHPLNQQVYDTDRDADELAASIAAHGILTPLTIDQDGTILSGHRRWQAARAAGLATVPVVVRTVGDPLEAETVLLESNRQREKTYTERMREADQLTRIFAEEARRRMIAGKADPLATLPEGRPDEGFTRTKVAEAVGMKPRTYAKTKKVYDAANDVTAPEPIRAVAQQLMVALDAGETTPNAAEKALREAETRPEARSLMDFIAASWLTDPPAAQAASARLHALIPSLPESDLQVVFAFAANLEVRSHAVQAHLVASYHRQNKCSLAATAKAFGTDRPTVASLLAASPAAPSAEGASR